jgi:hypothetical protein
VVHVARDLSDEQLISLGAFVAGRPNAVLLLAPADLALLRPTLDALAPARVVPVGSFPDGVPSGWQSPQSWDVEIPIGVFPGGEKGDLPLKVVICPARPRSRLLQSACLAGAEGAVLWVSRGRPGESQALRSVVRRLHRAGGLEQVILIGEAGDLLPARNTVKVTRLADEQAVTTAYLHRMETTGRVRTAVVCNPADTGSDFRGMSALGPWLAVRRQAALLLTEADGKNVAEVVNRAALVSSRSTPSRPGMEKKRRFEHLILLADLKAIPMEQRPNPIPGDKDAQIDLEPLTPPSPVSGSDARTPFSYAIGRLFHEDRAIVPLMLARQELLRATDGPRFALVASNPGGGLNLLETFSRTSARELNNAGYRTTTLMGTELTKSLLREAVPKADLFLWEGHHNTLVKEWGFNTWDEPLPPALHFLQSCICLQEEKAGPLLKRGAVAVVGTSTRTYSGSGGAFSLAYLNALVHEGRSLGESLRQAKNFMVAYALLKEKRLGEEAKRTGANLRASWAFTLWGDPTLRLPAPPLPAESLPGIRHEVVGRTLTLHLPDKPLTRVSTAKFQAEVWPNARLAGLVRKTPSADVHPLVPMVFAEVELPKVKPGVVPRLHGRIPSSHWVFTWDERRRVGYILILPRPGDGPDLRFHIDWQTAEVADSAE